MKKRKKQIANLLKLGVFLFGFSLLLWNCEKDENILESTNLENKHTFIKPELAIEEIKSIYNSNNHKRQKSSKEDQKVLNEINTKTLAKKNITDAGYKIYSFALKTSTLKKTVSSNLFFDNLFVNIDKGGNIAHHVVRYIPTKEWLESNRSITEYSGTIQYLSDLRSVVSSIELKKGVIIETSKKRKKNKTGAKGGCQLIYKMTVCGALDGDGLSCTHFYELQCGSGSSSSGSLSGGGDSVDGTNSGFGDLLDENESISGGGSGSSSNKGNSFTGSPIIGFCPDGTPSDVNGYCVEEAIIDNTNNPCVSAIIKALQEKDMKGALVPDLEGMGHLSQTILDLFDHSQTYNLTFKIGQLNNIGSGVNGNTKGFDITLDTDLVKNGTKLFIAKTVIHESLHAYIHYIMRTAPTSSMHSTLMSLHKLSGNKSNLTEHQFMGQYVEALAYSLSSYNNHQQPMDYYKALSWAGLESSSAYQSLSNTDKTKIQNIIQNERFNKSGAKSTKC